MNISNRFQMLHVAHPNSNWCRYCCGSCWWSFEREKLNTVLYLLSFFQLLYWTLNKKINISRPYQNFQKQNKRTIMLLYFLMFQFIPIPVPTTVLDVEKNNHCFRMVLVISTILPFHLVTGGEVFQLGSRPFCPTSSCRTVSTNWWVKPVVMPAMRCCGRFRSLGWSYGDFGTNNQVFTKVTRCSLVFVGPCLFAKFVNIYTCGSWINTVKCELMDIVTIIIANGKD